MDHSKNHINLFLEVLVLRGENVIIHKQRASQGAKPSFTDHESHYLESVSLSLFGRIVETRPPY